MTYVILIAENHVTFSVFNIFNIFNFLYIIFISINYIVAFIKGYAFGSYRTEIISVKEAQITNC